MTVRVEVLRRFTLNGTIDPHDPIGVTFRITNGGHTFRLTVISCNWGRGYDAGEFKRNVLNVLNRVDETEYAVILIQELDEADAAPEHKILRRELERGTSLVEWATREPILVSPGIPVSLEHKAMTMDQGTKIGGPAGTGPRRFITTCTTEFPGATIGFWNQHPHRYSIKDPAVKKARGRGEAITRKEVAELVEMCDLVIGGGDLNTPRYPKTHPREKVAHQRGLDSIRYIVT